MIAWGSAGEERLAVATKGEVRDPCDGTEVCAECGGHTGNYTGDKLTKKEIRAHN